MALAGFRIGDIPVPTKYFAEASSINFKRSVEYGLGILWILIKYILHKWNIVRYKQFETKKIL